MLSRVWAELQVAKEKISEYDKYGLNLLYTKHTLIST